jgi:hypothetical protein
MAVEWRNGRAYFYTSQRVGGRVVRKYGGSGQAAVLIGQLAVIERGERVQTAFERKDREARAARLDAKLRAWLARADGLVAAVLQAAGWHRPKRGDWRRKRGAVMNAPVGDTWDLTAIARAAGALDKETEAKAAKGDKTTLAAVERYLDNPAAVALYGDIGRHALHRWVRRYAGDNLVYQEALLRQARELRERLAGPTPTALDLIVAERVVLAWVFAGWADWQYASCAGDLTIKQADHHLRRVELANRHLLRACRTLASVRRAKLPDVLALVQVRPPELPAG